MDKETAIKSIEKGIRIAEAAESGWVWITIEQARKVLEILRDKMPTIDGWISVKDDLPKEFGEPCIVYNGSSVQYGDYFSNSEWYTPDCYESDEIRGVTHWMPLPKPPKEDKEDA